MKRTFKNIFLALTSSVIAFSSCIGDLDVNPLNPTEMSPNQAYGAEVGSYLQGLTKIYYSFINTSGLNVADGGASELIRAFWSTQEVTADACKCAWSSDAWVRDLNSNTWSEAKNDATYAVYCRTILGISYANEFLRSTTEDMLDMRGCDDAVKAKVRQFRAETRFIRAYLYWMAMDTFGNVPFTTENSPLGGGFIPTQTPRVELFNYIVDELNAIAASGDMPAAQSNYPRADIGSVYGLLARLYLNAEVYTATDVAPGTPMWAEAKAACEEIYKLGYSICPDYAALFRGDNGENAKARGEFLFAVPYDAEDTQSYGGTGYLTFAAAAATDVKDDKGTSDESDDEFFGPTGINNGWAGIRVPDPYVQTYFTPAAYDFEAGTYSITDKRGQMFNIKGQTQEMALYEFVTGWKCWKYNNYPHNKGPQDADALNTARSKSYSDIDFPLIRLGEIHLIYAEACMHLGAEAQALPKLKELADRAGVTATTSITQEFLVAERARELMWEAHRRTDLIRYGMYGGNTSYSWPFKGGDSAYGQTFEKYMEIFSIPPTELASNDRLVQNPGYVDGTAAE
jgi:hypothetical protein